ncbi:MAG: DUF721 domain-containing protein [Fulvivirga sp.]|nr:DUF721 domain-containing protein [Fulvivirga sp.]
MRDRDKGGRKSDITPVREAINNLFDTYKLNGKIDEARLITSWEDIMGTPIAKRTRRIFLKKAVLFIEVDSAPLKHELSMSRQKIIEKFREHLGKAIVDEVVIM